MQNIAQQLFFGFLVAAIGAFILWKFQKKQAEVAFAVFGIGAIITGVLAFGPFAPPPPPLPTATPDNGATGTVVYVTQLSSTSTPQPPATSTPQPPATAQSTVAVPPNPDKVGQTWKSPKDGMTLVSVPAGVFEMGSDDADVDEQPKHQVYLDGFWIDQTEVTNAMFEQFVQETGYQTDAEKQGGGHIWNGSDWSPLGAATWYQPGGNGDSLDGKGQLPVMLVTWNDARTYCNWAGRRLPTEAEWEKAARGLDGQTYAWGDEQPANRLLDVSQGVGVADPVGSYKAGASPYGALDMTGNVWEWVADIYGESYYATSPSQNPTGPTMGNLRVLRSGPAYFGFQNIRVAKRYRNLADFVMVDAGFRCAK